MSSSPVFLFPGQGSQFVGMGRDWADRHPAAARTFEEADEALGVSLRTLVFEGPEDELQLTANTQPAILACSIAMLRVLEAAGLPRPRTVAGHSLGEYSAAVAAGALAFADALRLVRRRGELMQEAVPVGEGAMAAILGLDRAAVEAVIAEVDDPEASRGAAGRVTLANINSPQQIVIAGHTAAVEAAAERARDVGAKLAKMLPVSAPFHSPLMAPAREGLEPLLAATSFQDPEPPIVTNVDAAPARDGAAVRDALVRQVDAPVRWVESIESIVAAGDGPLIEIGPGKVLFGLGRRIDRKADWRATPDVAEIDAFVASIAAE